MGTRHELAFLPPVLEVTETPASPAGRWLALAIAGLFTTAIAWSVIGEMDIIATAQGKIIPTLRTKVIQPLETGVVRAIHVSDGQRVREGDVLIELDPTGTAADVDRLRHDLAVARVEAARLEALLSAEPRVVYRPPPRRIAAGAGQAAPVLPAVPGGRTPGALGRLRG